MGQFELVARDKLQNVITLKNRKNPKLTGKMDAKYNLILAKNSVKTAFSLETKAKFSEAYSAPAMLVPKKNGRLRLIMDYRQLNKQTINSCRPIPSIEEIFNTLKKVIF